jgi:hypothetical protein
MTGQPFFVLLYNARPSTAQLFPSLSFSDPVCLTDNGKQLSNQPEYFKHAHRLVPPPLSLR